jgi:hypothetical protein
VTFEPPAASQHLVQGVPFDTAVDFAVEAKKRFDLADAKPGNKDPSRCKALLRFPDAGAVRGPVFWSSKMAIDADGPAAGPGRRTGRQLDPDGQDETSLRVAGGSSLPAETVAYIVLPQLAPHSNKTFDPAVGIGDMAVVIFKDRMTAAVCGDLGPFNKLGEASIRVHELLRPATPDPCSGRDANGFCSRVRNASVGEDVLFFVFPDSAFPQGELSLANIEETVKTRALALYDQFRGAS